MSSAFARTLAHDVMAAANWTLLATTIDIWSLLRAAGRALQQFSRSLTSRRIDVRGTASSIRRR